MQLPQVRVSVSDNLPCLNRSCGRRRTSCPAHIYMHSPWFSHVQPHFAMPYFRDIILYIQNNGLTLIVQVQLCSFLDRRALRGLSLGSAHSTVQFMVALVGIWGEHQFLALWKCTEGKRVYSLVTLSKKKLHTHMKYNSIPAAAT